MKKKVIITILLLVTAVSYVGAERFKINDKEVISRAFEDSKSELECFNTSYHGKLNNEFLSKDQLNEISEEYINLLSIEEVERQIVEETNMNQISVYGQVDDGGDITLIFYSYMGEEERAESTIFIDIKGSENYKEIIDIGSKIEQILKKQDINTDNTSCIIGTYRGELKSEHKMGIIESLIDSTKSEEVESLVEDSMISYSLYSKDIDDYIYSGKNKVNLNIAIRYNEYNNETSIFIASPIITVGY